MSLSQEEKEILDSIHIASENDPNNPEFPPENPKFPATPTSKLNIDGFNNVWIKDESYNPTWTHKDRMAWEIVVTYKDFLLSKDKWLFTWDLPIFSIISSWSAAISIQSLLSKYKLPNLKVLVDLNIDQKIEDDLKEIWCEIYKTDLSIKKLNTQEILKLTDNKDWFDITSNEVLWPTTRFYDWLSYEIINSSPDCCFIPFWTGNLYENILNINKYEVSRDNHDPRFFWNVNSLRNCNFIWATTNDITSRAAEKLYSPHLPFVHFDEQWINFFIKAWFCWKKSWVRLIKEEFLDEAIQIADKNNINFEASALAGLALFLEMKDDIDPNEKVLIVSTGKSKWK